MKIGLYRAQSMTGVAEKNYLFIPDAASYLISYLEDKIDFTNIYVDYDIKRLLEKKPDIIGLSSVTESIKEIYSLADKIKKELNIPIIIGGPHSTYLPESLPRSIDIGVIGEGEETFKELVELAMVNELVPEKLKNIKGIAYWDHDGNQQITEKRPLIKNIDDVPFPKRRHIDKCYYPLYQNIITSRGCPYKCVFCIETTFWTTTRFHSPERVLDEIEEIIRYFPEQKYITMADTIFAMNKKRLRKIAELIREAGIHKKVYFTCNARSNIFDEEVCEILKSMNVKNINFGFESGSDKVLQYLKGSVKARQNENALDLCEKHGFQVLSNILIGAPVETEEDAALSYWFIQHNRDRILSVSVHPMTPFPGSFMWRYAKDKNLIDEKFNDWENFNLVSEPSIFLNEQYTPADYVKISKWFYEYQIKKQYFSESQVNNNSGKNLYFNMVYKQLARLIPESCENILELSNATDRLEDYLDEKKNITKIRTYSGYVHDAELSENYFDLIVIIHALETLRKPDEILKKLSKLLKQDGMIVCVFYNCLNKGFVEMLLENGGISDFIWGPAQWKNIQMLTLSRIKNLFNESGYINLSILQQNINPDQDSLYSNLLNQIKPIPNSKADVTSFIVQVERNTSAGKSLTNEDSPTYNLV